MTPGPWKVIVAGNQWGISRTKAPRGEDDICGGSQYHDDWKANSKAIAALPVMIDALEHIAKNSGQSDLRGMARAALKAAGQ